MSEATGIALFCAGWCAGALVLWLYFKRAGMLRTRGEFYLARGIGDGACDELAKQIREDLLR